MKKIGKSMYAQSLKKIAAKWQSNEKISIIFLVNENAKWKSQSVYDKFNSDSRFDVKIVLTIADFDVYCNKKHRLEKLQSNEKFFLQRNIHCEKAWDTEKDTSIDLHAFSPDIVFYQVPYNIAKNQNIDYISDSALCMYLPYYINQSEEFSFMGTEEWHRKLFRFYVLDDYWKAVTAKNLHTDGENIAVAGSPLFDAYLEKEIDKNDKIEDAYVIYAAHWSVGQPDGLSSFMETGHFMLSYAKKHPEIRWCFTCHPTLIFNVVDKGFMSQQEVDDYVSAWKKIAYCPGTDGNYMELFRNSRMLISDCGSFRVEYFPTGKPYIYLISNSCKRLSDGYFMQEICKNYHHVHNCAELKMALDSVLINKDDCFKSERKMDKEVCKFTKISSAQIIWEDILHIMNGNCELPYVDFDLLVNCRSRKNEISLLRESVDFLAQRQNYLTLKLKNKD